MEHKHTNHLIDENSPYLLSHAHNPVDWYPWGDEALERARTEDKPIFLSIGYAACHWCHVMERESFENDEIAALLNENYVSIKVDREQRPDLDHIYMAFTTTMTGGGGWPMSVFLTPDLKPFFAGTYFPPDDAYGRPGFRKVVTEIARAYTEDKAKVHESAEKITADISRRLVVQSEQGTLTPDLISRGAKQLMRGFDPVHGGFGNAPKFPHATDLSLFLRHYRQSGDFKFLEAVQSALNGMAHGGIYDHLGGGFARYSVDEQWLVPHFEKMLYDNGLLVPVYAEAYQVTGNEEYLRVVRETLDFILREMTGQHGGFYSALDADSEGEEGKFYVWSKTEIENVLGDDADLFCRYYNVTDGGNFEGHNIINTISGSASVREEYGKDDFDEWLEASKSKLLENRAERIRPATDDKILTSWNGLALGALCKGYQVIGDERYLEAAKKNAEFVHTKLFRDGKLTHSYREGRHSTGQFLEDYGYYVHGLIELYQSDPSNDNSRWLEFAVELADNAVKLFMDDGGHLYLRDEGHDDLIIRPHDPNDGALPAPGSYLIAGLLKLQRLTESKELEAAANKALAAASGTMSASPAMMSSALLALDYHLSDKVEIVIVGDNGERDEMIDALNSRYLPNKVVAMSANGGGKGPLFEGRKVGKDQVLAFVCRNSVCRLPVGTVAEFEAELDQIGETAK